MWETARVSWPLNCTKVYSSVILAFRRRGEMLQPESRLNYSKLLDPDSVIAFRLLGNTAQKLIFNETAACGVNTVRLDQMN